MPLSRPPLACPGTAIQSLWGPRAWKSACCPARGTQANLVSVRKLAAREVKSKEQPAQSSG